MLLYLKTSYWLKLMYETKELILPHISTLRDFAAIFEDC